MKRIMMILAAVLCCVMTMVADPVSPDVAQQAAAKFLQARGQWKTGGDKPILRVQCHRLTGLRRGER